MSEDTLAVFGEVLFDVFPGGERVLGGAPFNVAWHLQAFGAAPLFISRVGDDVMGDEIISTMSSWGMSLSGVQSDRAHATGQVQITLEAGEPSYDILPHQAYDYIEPAFIPSFTPRLTYHGSLALRNSQSREAFEAVCERGGQLFLDVNLRPPWWQTDQLLELVEQAHWVKLNEHELIQLSSDCDDIEEQARAFREEHFLDGVVVTRGGEGAFAIGVDGELARVHPEGSQSIVDTVGAGDAFASVLILGISRYWPLEQTLERAQAFASQLVTRRGATVNEPEFYRQFIEEWNL